MTIASDRESLANLFALSPELMCILDSRGAFTMVSPSFSALGYEPVALQAQCLADFVHPDDLAEWTEQLGALDWAGEHRSVEVRVRTADASYRWISWALSCDEFKRGFAVGRDVTKENESKQKVERLNRFLDAIVENIPNMVFVKDERRLSFVRFNLAGETLLGVNRDQLLGKNDYDLFPAEEAAFFQEKDRETLRGKVLVDIPAECIPTPAGQRWLHTKKVPILDEHGEPEFLLGISEDITELKHAREELIRSREEARSLNQELESFSYSVAHDLRAPLRSIDGFSQALLEDFGEELNAEGQKYLAYLRESAQLMAQLIDDILTLSRVGRSELAPVDVNLSELAEKAFARLQGPNPTRSVSTAIEAGVSGKGDPRLLSVVFDNLLGNSLKFTEQTEAPQIAFGRVPETEATMLGSESVQGEVVYFVQDNGVGFDMKYADKLFGVFQRLHSERDFAGTGVGLATVQRIIHRHGGRIWAEASVGRGATFYFTLEKRSEDERGE